MLETERLKLYYVRLLATESSASLVRTLGYIVEAFGGLALLGTVVGVVLLMKDNTVDGSVVVAWGLSALFGAIVALSIGAALVVLGNYVGLRAIESEKLMAGLDYDDDE